MNQPDQQRRRDQRLNTATGSSLHLQRALGNQGMQCLIQAKLTINQPGDVYEQEADRVADEIMRMPDLLAAPLQRTCACGDEPGVDGECAACRDKRLAVQRQAVKPSGNGEEESAPPIIQDVLGSSGQPLDPATRAFFEPRFGYNFSPVRVHTDEQAAASAHAIGALAYTIGQNVVFGQAQYKPATTAGRQLLAHELVHVIQQTDKGTTQRDTAIVQ